MLNCVAKVVKKVIAGLLSQFCETFSKLHSGQMGVQRQEYSIDAPAFLVHKVQESSAEKKPAAALFMDVKGDSDYISKTKLVGRMMELGIDRDIIQRTKSLLID